MIDIQPTKETNNWNPSLCSPSSSSSSIIDLTDDRTIPAELLQSLRQHSLFQRTNNESFIEKLACCMHLRSYSPRDIIIVEGEPAKAMFFLLKGYVDVCSADFERIYATLPRGSCFGEIGILYSMDRTATVVAKTKCLVAALTAEEVQGILPYYPEVEKMLRFEAEERLALLRKSKNLHASEKVTQKPLTERNVEDLTGARNLLQKIPYFQDCPEEFLHSISLKVEPRHYAPNDFISKKGEEGRELYFIVSGTMEIINMDSAIPDPNIPIRRLSAGEYFGDIAVVLNTPRAADARAVTSMEMYVLKKSDFMSVLDSFPDLKKHFEAMAESSLNDLKFKASLISKVDVDTEAPMNTFDQGRRRSSATIITPDSVCSTTSDQDPTLPAATVADAFRNVETKRRRASVAIWSDPNLVALANRHIKEPKEESKLKQNVKTTEDVPMSPAQFTADGQLSSLSEAILCRIMNYLDFPSIIQFAFTSKRSRELVQQSENILHTLDLSSVNKRVTDSSITNILPYTGARVKHLKLSNCFYLTDEGFATLVNALPNVQSMDLNSCWLLTDKSMATLAASCPQVTKLNLSNCRKISDVGIFRLLDGKTSELQELSLSYCKRLTDTTMGYLVDYCADSLQSLNLQRCTRITDKGFEAWSRAEFSRLRYLNLTDCSFLTDVAVAHLVAAAKHLQHLCISFCCALSDNAMEELASLLELEVLDASFCGAAVSDVSIRSLLSRNDRRIKSLSLRGCVRVTDACVEAILERACLSTLNISQCPGVSMGVKETIRSSGNVQELVA